MQFINSELQNKQTERFQELSILAQEKLSGGQLSRRTSSKRGDDDDVDIPDTILWDLAGGN